jgi:hypothetical protein
MGAISTTTAKSATSKKSKPAPQIEVKSELRELMAATKDWRTVDAQANGLLYNLLGTLYELSNRITTKHAIAALRNECGNCDRIRQSKMWKIAKKPVPELLVAYVLGTDDTKASTRSQWKKVIQQGKKLNVPSKRKAFSYWLHDSGGIEGVLSGGKQKSPNRAAVVDFSLETYASSFDPSALPLQLAVDLSDAASFSDATYTNDFALVLVRKATDLETGKSKGFAVVDVVNDAEMVTKAAQTISQQHNKKH